jgi:hypothetical protein
MTTHNRPKPESPQPTRQTCGGFVLRVPGASVMSIHNRQTRSAPHRPAKAPPGREGLPPMGPSCTNKPNLPWTDQKGRRQAGPEGLSPMGSSCTNKPNLPRADRKGPWRMGPGGLSPVGPSCTNKPNLRWSGRRQVFATGKEEEVGRRTAWRRPCQTKPILACRAGEMGLEAANVCQMNALCARASARGLHLAFHLVEYKVCSWVQNRPGIRRRARHVNTAMPHPVERMRGCRYHGSPDGRRNPSHLQWNGLTHRL